MDASLKKSEKYALTGTILFHVLLFILFLFAGLTYMEPPPPEQGILINFGTSDDGMGQNQSVSSTVTNTKPIEEEVVENTASQSVEEEVLTQNSEQAPTINSQKNEIIKKEEVKEEPKPSKEFSEAVSKWKNKSDNKASSDGITGKEGDQGDESGSLESGNYVGGPGGSGFSFSLGGRRMVNKPKINDVSQEEGKVVVDIIVDKYGKVVRASPGARGSTTTSQVLYKIAKEAAMSTKFNINQQGPEEQKGQIVFTFLVKG